MKANETTIYEGRDTTNDEMHYPIGLWLDLDAAIRDVAAIQNPLRVCDHLYDDADCIQITIVARKTGLSGDSEYVIRKFEWIQNWSDDYGTCGWISQKPEQEPPMPGGQNAQ